VPTWPPGTLKKVIADRGFGFIVAEDAKECFFHRGGLDSSLDFDRLTGGERVEFEIEQSPKGPRAPHVRAAQSASRPVHPDGQPPRLPCAGLAHPAEPPSGMADPGLIASPAEVP
jgi:CspA family cold shock protein